MAEVPSIDINADVGESYGHFRVGQDEALMPYLSSCNIACGFHGGDPSTMMQTLMLAQQFGVKVGAHPSYPDLRGFGRQPMLLPNATLIADTLYQISALGGMARSLDMRLEHVKPHGALYHHLMQNEEAAEAFVVAVRQYDPQLALLGMPDSALARQAATHNMDYIREGFLDRAYVEDGQLAPRSAEGAILRKIEDVQQQVQQILVQQRVTTLQGNSISLEIDTLCLHGDHPDALEIAQATHETLHQIPMVNQTLGIVSVKTMGDKALLIQFEDRMAPEIRAQVRSTQLALEALQLAEVAAYVPAHSSLVLHLHQPLAEWKSIQSIVHNLSPLPEESLPRPTHWRLPVLYGGGYGPDLSTLAEFHGMTESELISLHTSQVYDVYMLGFQPGFAYLGPFPTQLATPRHRTPRPRIAAGSVAISGFQTCIYPMESAGGWQLIGRCPISIIGYGESPPTFWQTGDQASFVEIDLAGWKRWQEICHRPDFSWEQLKASSEDSIG